MKKMLGAYFYQARSGHMWVWLDKAGIGFQLDLEQCQHIIYSLGGFNLDPDEYSQEAFDLAYSLKVTA